MAPASVLLVQSIGDDREMYAEFLRIHALDVRLADTADEAFVRGMHADVVVTEIRIHGSFDGYELIRRLRRNQWTARKAIVALTACAFDSDRRAAQQAGCDVFLAKPCLPDTLLAVVRRLLRRSQLLRGFIGSRERVAKVLLRLDRRSKKRS